MTKYSIQNKMCSVVLMLFAVATFAQQTNYSSSFNYKDICTASFIPIAGFNDTQTHYFTILKHSFEIQKINSAVSDTSFSWNGLKGKKIFYSNDSLSLFFLRPNDNAIRPCILLTHGNGASYKGSWHEQMNFYAVDLAMRGFCEAYYENPASVEAHDRYTYSGTRNAFYGGFQAAVAAEIYVVANATILNVDTAKLISGGMSFGAFCSLTLATANQGVNFTDSIYLSQGTFTAKAKYSLPYSKRTKHTFSIGGGFPKEDTTVLFQSKMGEFLDSTDTGVSMLFLHGQEDNLIHLGLTLFGNRNIDSTLFYVEGPLAVLNKIHKYNLALDTKLIVNCVGGHPFINTVCAADSFNCIQQYQWGYLSEPPAGITSTHSYFTQPINDTLLHYFTYMVSQFSEVGAIVADFLLPLSLLQPSTYIKPVYYVQPKHFYNYSTPKGYYLIKNTDCDGNAIPTAIPQKYTSKVAFVLYPNPVNSYLTIKTAEPILSVEIYGMNGELMKIENTNSTVFVGDLPMGRFVVLIHTLSGYNTANLLVVH